MGNRLTDVVKIIVISIALFCVTGISTKAQLVRTFSGHSKMVMSVTFSPDGRYALSGGADETVRLWEVATGREVKVYTDNEGEVWSVAVSPDGRYILSASVYKIQGISHADVDLWEMDTARRIGGLHSTVPAYTVSFSPDGKYAITGNANQKVRLWDVETGQEVRSFKGHSGWVDPVSFSPDGRYVLSAGKDRTVRMWKVAKGKQVRTFKGHTDEIWSVAFSPDGRYVLSGSADKTVRLWEVGTGRQIRSFIGHKKTVFSVVFSPDGRYVVSGSGDGTVRLWEVGSGREIRSFVGHKGSVRSVAVSPDGHYVLSGGSYGEIKLWFLSYKSVMAELVQKKIDKWQQKSMFETTEAYRKRVTPSARQELIQTYTDHVIDSLGAANFNADITDSQYDADNQTFKLTFANGSSIYLMVPLNEAPVLHRQINRLQLTDADYALTGDEEFILRKATFFSPINGKSYTYDSGRQISFNTADLTLNFDPIEVDVQTEQAGQNVREGKTTIEVGKADVDMNIPKTGIKNPNAVAVVIGIRDYRHPQVPDVSYAANDARIMRRYLTDVLGFDEANILPRNPDQLMTAGAMKTLIRHQLPAFVRERRSDVFVYFSGHGAPSLSNQKAYLVPVDTDPNFVNDDNAYALDSFYEDLSELQAKSLTVVLDACFTGQSGSGEMMIRNASPLSLTVKNPLLNVDNATVFTASADDQVANWYPQKGHGMFTYFFLKGLRGAADINVDKRITVGELERYLLDQNEGLPYWSNREFQRLQIPQIITKDKNKVLVEY